nr:hypothetical protein [Caballeronia temeraria]
MIVDQQNSDAHDTTRSSSRNERAGPCSDSLTRLGRQDEFDARASSWRSGQPKRGAEPVCALAHDVKADMRLAKDGHLLWIVALTTILDKEAKVAIIDDRHKNVSCQV